MSSEGKLLPGHGVDVEEEGTSGEPSKVSSADIDGELADSLANVSIDERQKVREKLVHLVALIAIRAHNNKGLRDFKAFVHKTEGEETPHVSLSYVNKDGSRPTNVYLCENISGDGHVTLGTKKEAVLFQIKKYFDSYQWIKSKGKSIDSASEIDRLIVCVSNLSRLGKMMKQIAPEEAILVNGGIDDILSTKLMVFKDIAGIQKRLLPSLKDSDVEKPQSSTHLVPGKELLNDTKVSEVIAFYLLTLITMNIECKSIQIDSSHRSTTKLVIKLSRCCQSNMSGSYSFRREFLDGASVDADIETFRNTLKLGLHAIGRTLSALGDYTFHFNDHLLKAHEVRVSKKEVKSFLEKLRFCQQPEVTAEPNDSLENEMKKCLNVIIVSRANEKFIELVSGLIDENMPITDITVIEFLEGMIGTQGLMEMSLPVDPDIDYRPMEEDIVDKCFCEAIIAEKGYKDCCSSDGPRGCLTESTMKQLARGRRLHYEYVHQGLLINLGRKHLKTREIRMRLAYTATLEGQHQMAFDLTEGELDQDDNPTAHTISKGFQHVRGLALIGLGRHVESVEYLVSSCIYRTRGTLSIKRPAFRATINIVHGLVCQGKVKFANKFLSDVLDNVLEEEGPLTQMDSLTDESWQDGERNQFEFVNECIRQLAFAVFARADFPEKSDPKFKELLNFFKSVHLFFINRLGDEHMVTLEMKYVYVKVYLRVVKRDDKMKRAFKYFLELHSSQCKMIQGRDDYSRRYSLYVLHWQLLLFMEIWFTAGFLPAKLLIEKTMSFAILIHNPQYLVLLKNFHADFMRSMNITV